MGKLMALALVTTMAAAVLFQPVLMGPPRERARKSRGPGSGKDGRTDSADKSDQNDKDAKDDKVSVPA
jgi:hypothetical protein